MNHGICFDNGDHLHHGHHRVCDHVKERRKEVNGMTVNIFDTANRYNLIYADPPWKQSRGGKKSVRANSSGKPLEYPVCSLSEIKEHLKQADSLAEGDTILFLWTIDKYLFEAQQMAEEMGYKLHARMIWDKVTGIPAAFTVRYGHEYLLYMYKGKLMPVAKDERGKYIQYSAKRCSGTAKSRKSHTTSSSGYTPTQAKSNCTPANIAPGGIVGGTKYEDVGDPAIVAPL